MEQKLKQQRNKLFLKIILILSAMWLVISAAYCSVRLYSEKSNIPDREHMQFSGLQTRFSNNGQSPDQMYSIFLNDTNIVYFKNNMEMDTDTQIRLIDRRNGRIIADTANKCTVNYRYYDGTIQKESYGFLRRSTVKDALSSSQYDEISELLNSDDGQSRDIICTKFYIRNDEYVPIEIKAVVIPDEDKWFEETEVLKTFTLDKNLSEDETVYTSDDDMNNIIPEDFLLTDRYNKDYISLLSDEQLKSEMELIQTGTTEYIFYVWDYVYIKGYTMHEDFKPGDGIDDYVANDAFYLIQYARKVDILKNCAHELVVGTGVIFVFFFVIAVILCIMIWKMVKLQILQEQKRADLTNALAHDIKTPLFVISGYAYSLKEDIDENERDTYLEKIIEQTEEVNRLVHRMLNFSKLDSYKMTLNRTEFGLDGLLSEMLRDYSNLPDGKSTKLTHSGSSNVSADKELIITVFRNLLDNAVKYSLTESVIGIEIDGKTVRISNSSEPLSKEELKQIWQPYVRKDKSRRQRGNGLGLSIVKSILDLHGAKYDIRQKGQTFTVSIDFT